MNLVPDKRKHIQSLLSIMPLDSIKLIAEYAPYEYIEKRVITFTLRSVWGNWGGPTACAALDRPVIDPEDYQKLEDTCLAELFIKDYNHITRTYVHILHESVDYIHRIVKNESNETRPIFHYTVLID